MSSFYQTSAKPRGRRETGASESSARSRAPSESSNLTKKVSRTSDDSISARSTTSRPNSPATFMQRHRTLDRSSLLETILPTSSVSSSPNLNKANAASDVEVPLVIPRSKPHASTPTSPILTSSKLESRAGDQPLYLRASSKSMTEAVKPETGEHIITPTPTLSSVPHAGKNSSSAAYGHPGTSQHSAKVSSLQPSVADASEENTPIPTPAVENVHIPLTTDQAPRADWQARTSAQDEVSPKQHERAVPQPQTQATQSWYPEPVSHTWHQTTSPPQSPVTHQYGGFQTPGQLQYPYDYSYGFAPQMAPGGYQQYASPYYPMPFSPPTETIPPPPVERHISRSGSGEEQKDLMNRIQSVLPDLARLLEQSREGQAPSSAAESIISQNQLGQNEQLAKLQQDLDATKKEYERVIRKLVDENCSLKNEAEDRLRRSRSLEGDSRGNRKLKTEFETLQAQHQDLASSVDSIRLSKEELIAEKLGVEKHIESLKKDKHIIKDSHHRVLAELKQQHLQELATKDHEYLKAAAEHKSVLSKVQLDLATLITKHTNTRKELEITRSSEATYKASAEAKSKELDTAKSHHCQQSDKLKADHQRTLESLKQEHKSQRQRHENETRKYVTELEAFRSKEKEWESKSEALRIELQEHKIALVSERDAHASLKILHDERSRRTADLAGSMASWRTKHAELQKENENLDRVLHALGFGSTAAETKVESQPPTILGDKLTASEEANASTEAPPEVRQEFAISPTEKVIAPVQKQVDGKEGAEVPIAESRPLKEPAPATVSPNESESLPAKASASATEATTAPEAVEVLRPVETKDRPAEPVTMRANEKATKSAVKASEAPAQTAEEAIVFRPIHYYQVPGQYQ